MEDSEWYKNDRLGLKTLNEDGRLLQLHLSGKHDWLIMEDAADVIAKAL